METAKTETPVRKVKRSTQPTNHIVEVATDTQVCEESRQYVTSPLKRSATSSWKHQQARPVPITRQHPTARARKQRRPSRSNSSKPRTGVSSPKPPEYGQLPQSCFLRLRLQLSSHVLCSYVEVVLSLVGRDGIKRKRPFDRGKK